MKKVLLLWYTINNNFGDVLIYETVKDTLETSGMEVSYIDVGNPCKDIFYEANKHDFLLFAGGGIIERYVPNVIRYFQEDFDELTVPYGVIGLSIGGFDYTKYKDQIGFWVRNAEFFYTRDEYSAKYLNRLCSVDKVVEGVDIVWANNRIIKNASRKFKGINVRDVPYLDIYEDLDWKRLKEVVEELDFDYAIADESEKEVEVNLLNNSKIVQYSVDVVLEQIWSCRIIIAMRYHVILAAAANGIPVLPIAYCPKVTQLAKQIGISDFEVSVYEIDKIEEKLEKICKNSEQIKEKLHIKSELMRNKANMILYHVCQTINHC